MRRFGGRCSAALPGLQSLFLLAVRLYWGWQFAGTGWGKLHHLAKVTAFFASLGEPPEHPGRGDETSLARTGPHR